MSELEQARATMTIDITVDCPNCESYINIMDPDDTNGQYKNDCGELLKQACPNKGHWSDAHEDFECEEVTCSECKTTFNVKDLNW